MSNFQPHNKAQWGIILLPENFTNNSETEVLVAVYHSVPYVKESVVLRLLTLKVLVEALV